MKENIVSTGNIKVKEDIARRTGPVLYCMRVDGNKVGSIAIDTLEKLEKQIKNDLATIDNFIKVAETEEERIQLQTAKKNILECELLILGGEKEINRLSKKMKNYGKIGDYYGF
jgi:hypothetical protein